MIFARFQSPTGGDVISGALVKGCLRELAGPPWQPPEFTGREFDVASWRPVCPVSPGQIIGVGKNFAPHAAALPARPPTMPILFHKAPGSVVDPECDVRLPPGIARIKFEAELAVVIGRRTHAVSCAAALEHVCGYTIANDFAALELFHPDGHWMLGKSCDTFCPLGPVITTALDLSAVRVRSSLNGLSYQDSALDLMITTLPRLIELISRYLTLEPGDVILTGTPHGAGFAADGDVVECAIDGIGRLRNSVRNAYQASCRHSAPLELGPTPDGAILGGAGVAGVLGVTSARDAAIDRATAKPS